MSWHRGILVGIGLLVAATAQAQQTPHVRAGVWRKLSVAPAGVPSEAVPELRVAPGSATLLHLPSPIVPGGFVVSGGQARIDVQQVTPTTLVIVPVTEVGPERIPLAVATADQRRYPFLMATRPEVVDLEVRVVFRDPSEAKPRSNDDLLEALLKRQGVHARRYEPDSRPGDLPTRMSVPVVEAAVRMGDRYFIQLFNSAREPWKVQQAKLQGSAGILEVEGISWARAGPDENINVVVAKVPSGVSSDYALTAMELVGEDGRVARVKKVITLP